MKRFRLINICFVTIILFSCSNKLEQVPKTDKVSQDFYQTESEIEGAVNGVYATLQFGGNYDHGIPAIGELGGEDAYDQTPANDGGYYGQIADHHVVDDNAIISDNWEDSYKGIQRASIVLNQIEDVDFENNEKKDHRKGEVKFIRALYYFNLVRIYGDVPLVVDEVEDPLESFGQERTDKSEVYDQIIEDLSNAVDLLPKTNDDGRADKTAAQALLGKVYFTLDKNSEAKTLFEDVVNSGEHELLSNVEDIFSVDNELNKEIIFAVQFASGLSANSEGTDAYRLFNPSDRVENGMSGTKGHGVIKADFINSFDDDDKRKGTYFGLLSSGIGYNKKIAVPTTEVGDSDSDWVVLRYPDVLLSLAEIENEDGNIGSNNDSEPGTAIGYINMVRERAGIGKYSGNTNKNSVFEEIGLQRRKELIWEGHRWFDLLRQGRAKEVLGIDEDKLLMPIPSNQTNTDDALKQNPGY